MTDLEKLVTVLRKKLEDIREGINDREFRVETGSDARKIETLSNLLEALTH